MLFHSHIFNPISTGVSKPSLVSQLGSPSRRTATVKCATIILRDEFESLCERGLPLFFLEHGACAGDRIDDFVGDQLCRLARSGGGGDVRIESPTRLPSGRVGAGYGRCCTARSKSLTSLCRLQSHPAQYVSGIPSAAILLSISHPIRCSTRCLANVRARISGPMIAL